MRLLVFFDLPVKTKEERKQATDFRKFLIDDGYYMIQFSLYGRICGTIENAEQHEQKLYYHLPKSGSIRCLTVTEKQYASIKVLLGNKHKKDRRIADGQLSFFLKKSKYFKEKQPSFINF